MYLALTIATLSLFRRVVEILANNFIEIDPLEGGNPSLIIRATRELQKHLLLFLITLWLPPPIYSAKSI